MIRSVARALAAPVLLGTLLLASAAPAEPVKPLTREGDVTVKDFTFRSGESLADVRLHYTTLGTPHRDAKGHVDNAILILHGTGGTGAQFLRPQFSDVLFQPGGVLDPARYFIILPDDIGHGKSSKPSDGLRARFPKYDYDDMVALEHELVTKGLGVDHLRLVMGTSMGCMHAFVWGETYRGAMDALMPLACLPQTIAGRNRLWRQMSIAAIKADPAWQGGEYKTQPKEGLRTAAALLAIAGSAPIQMQKTYPTREAADAAAEKILTVDTMEANDLIYQLDASRTYDPSPKLETITAPVLWINSGDDFINPPELGLAEPLAKRIPHGQFVLIPASDQTHGHGSHTWAVLWQDKLADLLARTAPRP
ncbi:alpha/beta fold hydrolase [Azospirillum sp. B4]|uniref:alpha/beta fold hydrolase n=1 Tax=Azospirillum sp. B4 TaxID=95605 RepID=UPI0005CA9C62|nr:alpha/beta fold hydrolase [Azospirillum sp. B4]